MPGTCITNVWSNSYNPAIAWLLCAHTHTHHKGGQFPLNTGDCCSKMATVSEKVCVYVHTPTSTSTHTHMSPSCSSQLTVCPSPACLTSYQSCLRYLLPKGCTYKHMLKYIKDPLPPFPPLSTFEWSSQHQA